MTTMFASGNIFRNAPVLPFAFAAAPVDAFAGVDEPDGNRHRALPRREVPPVGVHFDYERDRVAVVDLPYRLDSGERTRGDAVAPVKPEPVGVHTARDVLA